jgi:pyrimidine operon attenuation protein/uracil phosphoribosyltransferase
MTEIKNYILDQAVAEKKLRRMALQIIENNPNEELLILAGIRESGSVVARYIQKAIAITLDKKKPEGVELSKSIDFNNQVVIVIDDVADSGRTLLYALKPFLNFHPRKIQTLVLVQRSHNSFPVTPDYVGVSIATTLQEQIYVEVDEERVTGAYLK